MTALYRRIKDDLLAAIHRGDYETGARIESENELRLRFGVSRLTVQRALRELVAEGILERRQGAGTFVRSATERFSLFEVRDLAEEIARHGHEPSSEVLLQRRIRTNAELASTFEFEPGAPLFHVQILQLQDDVPVAIEDRYALPEVFSDFLEQDFASVSVFHYLARHSRLERVVTSLRAVLPTKQIATTLQIDQQTPCLSLTRTNRQSGQIVTLTQLTYAGDRFSLSSEYEAG